MSRMPGIGCVAQGGVVGVLAIPTLLALEWETESTYTIRWEDNSPGVTEGFQLFYSYDGGVTFGVFSLLLPFDQFSMEGINAGSGPTYYQYYVVARRGEYEMSDPSNIVGDVPAPGQPQNLVTSQPAGLTATWVSVAWDAPITGGPADSYSIYRSASPPILIATTPGEVFAMDDTSILGSTGYTYYVDAINANGATRSGESIIITKPRSGDA